MINERFLFLDTLGINTQGKDKIITKEQYLKWVNSIGNIITNLSTFAVLSPYLEIKIGIAFGLYETTYAYKGLCKRLEELKVEVPIRNTIDPVLSGKTELSIEDTSWELKSIADEMNNVLMNINQLADWPSVRLLRKEIIPSLIVTVDLLDELVKIPLKTNCLTYMGDRDDRYTTFNHTRNYEEGKYGNKERGNLIQQLRTQRDELDAIETFARLIAVEPKLNSSDLLELARIVADEGRHSLIGEICLDFLEIDPISVPVGTIGAELRSQLTPWEALAQICLIGEAGNLKEIENGSRNAYDFKQHNISVLLKSIYTDESYHISKGVELLKNKTPDIQIKKLQSDILEKTNKFLETKGIPKVTLREAGRLLGE
ncbi:hypothetical protein [Oceanobacillus sp. 1P07AA]|uniref:hypothetical protein n=1 Tax=Oceanobacillus sp. 1P07AA TaxID=3132293 RepID=UPI0039A751AF